MEDEDFYITVDIEDIFNSIIKSNPDLTSEQRVAVWEICKETIEEIEKESERVTCLNV